MFYGHKAGGFNITQMALLLHPLTLRSCAITPRFASLCLSLWCRLGLIPTSRFKLAKITTFPERQKSKVITVKYTYVMTICNRLGIFLNWKLQSLNDIVMLKLVIYIYFKIDLVLYFYFVWSDFL